jgi:hypothetical protein
MRKIKKLLVWCLIFAMIFVFFSGCSISTAKIELQNLLDYDVYELYISREDDQTWGDSFLGSAVFGDNQTIQVELDVKNTSSWDIQAVDSDGDYYFFYNLPLANATTVQLIAKNDGCEAVVIPKKGAQIIIPGEFELGQLDAPEVTAAPTPDDPPEVAAAPTPDDPLDSGIAMPGYESLWIPYPSTMEITKDNERFLHFEAVNDPDYKEAVMFDLVQLGGTYEQRLQNASSVQAALLEIVVKITNLQFPDQVIQSIGEDYIDGGSYYSVISYLWLSGSVFTESSDVPVRGVVECRYYGPMGYILVAITLADESAVHRYFKIAQNILDNVDFGISWQTPVTSDAQWIPPDEIPWYNGYEDYDPWSDPGDYYDDSYDPWSDPGDYYDDDYDPWSDPGDYYDDDYGYGYGDDFD